MASRHVGFPRPRQNRTVHSQGQQPVWGNTELNWILFLPQIPREQLKESFLSFLFTYKARTRSDMSIHTCPFFNNSLHSIQYYIRRPHKSIPPFQTPHTSIPPFQSPHTPIPRALAQQQLTWHRKGGRFTWLNMAPGPEGRRLDVGEVGERVTQWLENDTPFPPEWDGASLMTLVCKSLLKITSCSRNLLQTRAQIQNLLEITRSQTHQITRSLVTSQ